MIFAAGFGTRMGALTKNMPKPMLTVAGIPLIDRAIALARSAGIHHITANLHYQHETLASHLASQNIHLSIENPHILETGGGLRHALPLVGQGAVFTLNPDALWLGPNPLELLAQAWSPTEMDALLMVLPPAQAHGYTGKGDFLLSKSGQLARGPGMVYSGAQIIKTELLHDIKEQVFSLNKLWDIMEGRGRLFGLPYPASWCDVGTPAGLLTAEKLLGSEHV